MKTILILGTLACLLKNGVSIVLRIHRTAQAPHQITLQRLVALPRYQGARIYTMCGFYGGAANWDQAHLLASELYGDFEARNGGLTGFLQDKGALLLIPRGREAEQAIKRHGIKVILAGAGSMVCEHSTPEGP